jgi:hypothetical protein
MHRLCVDVWRAARQCRAVDLEDSSMAPVRDRKRPTVSITLDRSVLERLERIAEAEQRPLSGLLRLVISDWSAGRRPRIEVEAA